MNFQSLSELSSNLCINILAKQTFQKDQIPSLSSVLKNPRGPLSFSEFSSHLCIEEKVILG
jgi:hypothetical protein